MKYITASILLIIWMVVSLLMVCTIIGIMVFVIDESGWSAFPTKLLSVFSNNQTNK